MAAPLNFAQEQLRGYRKYTSCFARLVPHDRAAVRFVLRGRHTGSFFGIPPTQQSIAVAGQVFLYIAGGQVTRLLGIFDEAGMLRQLGALG